MERLIEFANIVWKIKRDIEFDELIYRRFEKFQVKSKKEDILNNLIGIESNSEYKVGFNEINNLILGYPFKILGDIKSELLLFSIVYEYLKTNIYDNSYISIEINKRSITFMNFRKNELHTFYQENQRKFLKKTRPGWHVFANFLPLFDAIMIHSSAVIIENKAALFIAPDEGGKTTIVELLQEKYPIITDDQNIIRKENDKYYCYGTPWGLYTNKSAKAEIGGIFLIEKSDKFKLTPLNSNYIFAFLCREHYANFTYLRDEGRKKYFRLLSDICSKFPAYKLQFPKNYVDGDAIDRAMKK